MKKSLSILLILLATSLGVIWSDAPAGAVSAFNSPPTSPLPPPTQVSQCKQGGWKNLAPPNGTKFASETECVRYVKTGK